MGISDMVTEQTLSDFRQELSRATGSANIANSYVQGVLADMYPNDSRYPVPESNTLPDPKDPSAPPVYVGRPSKYNSYIREEAKREGTTANLVMGVQSRVNKILKFYSYGTMDSEADAALESLVGDLDANADGILALRDAAGYGPAADNVASAAVFASDRSFLDTKFNRNGVEYSLRDMLNEKGSRSDLTREAIRDAGGSETLASAYDTGSSEFRRVVNSIWGDKAKPRSDHAEAMRYAHDLVVKNARSDSAGRTVQSSLWGDLVDTYGEDGAGTLATGIFASRRGSADGADVLRTALKLGASLKSSAGDSTFDGYSAASSVRSFLTGGARVMFPPKVSAERNGVRTEVPVDPIRTLMFNGLMSKVMTAMPPGKPLSLGDHGFKAALYQVGQLYDALEEHGINPVEQFGTGDTGFIDSAARFVVSRIGSSDDEVLEAGNFITDTLRVFDRLKTNVTGGSTLGGAIAAAAPITGARLPTAGKPEYKDPASPQVSAFADSLRTAYSAALYQASSGAIPGKNGPMPGGFGRPLMVDVSNEFLKYAKSVADGTSDRFTSGTFDVNMLKRAYDKFSKEIKCTFPELTAPGVDEYGYPTETTSDLSGLFAYMMASGCNKAANGKQFNLAEELAKLVRPDRQFGASNQLISWVTANMHYAEAVGDLYKSQVETALRFAHPRLGEREAYRQVATAFSQAWTAARNDPDAFRKIVQNDLPIYGIWFGRKSNSKRPEDRDLYEPETVGDSTLVDVTKFIKRELDAGKTLQEIYVEQAVRKQRYDAHTKAIDEISFKKRLAEVSGGGPRVGD